MKKVGLVTVLFNSPSVLPDFYSSVEKQNYQNKHLYIVDNSTNQDSFNLTQEILLETDIKYTYINNEGNNVGVAQANNQGIEQALKDGCEYILLTNNDLFFQREDTISKMISVAEEGQYKLVSPVIFSYPEKKFGMQVHFLIRKKLPRLIFLKDPTTMIFTLIFQKSAITHQHVFYLSMLRCLPL